VDFSQILPASQTTHAISYKISDLGPGKEKLISCFYTPVGSKANKSRNDPFYPSLP
jgi:hypothetical protein